MKGIGQGNAQYDNRKSLAIALTGASISTVALLFFSGILGISVAVLGCAVCLYSLRYPM
jgi:hypothetical protein